MHKGAICGIDLAQITLKTCCSRYVSEQDARVLAFLDLHRRHAILKSGCFIKVTEREAGTLMSETAISTLFLDIGGVLLTNGWGRNSRKLAAAKFNLDFEDMDERHHLTFDTYEEGKLSLDEYLARVIFHCNRPFSPDEFKTFIFEQSRPFPDMIDLIAGVKARYGLKVVALNNEGRELSIYRIRKFALNAIIDMFVSSCFVHFRKPDPDIYCMALDISHAEPDATLYIDDRELFTEVATGYGIARTIYHRSYEETRKALEGFGLTTRAAARSGAQRE